MAAWDRLSPGRQAWLRSFRGDDDFFGILEPREAGPGVQAISRPTARLFQRLGRPARLPAEFLEQEGAAAARTAARLVLDGVLEIEGDGAFVGGPAAHAVLFTPTAPAIPRSGTARLSRAALHYGESLRLRDAALLAARLYRFNTEPATPRLRRDLGGRDAIGRLLRSTGISWVQNPARAWLTWAPPRPGPPVEGRRHYKLYLSIPAAHLPDALPTALGVLRRVPGIDSAKLGADIPGLIRPDKFVVYFARRRDLRAAARLLAPALEGLPAQGVPFSAGLERRGVLSWGAEPAADEPVPAGWQGTSWRTRIVSRLASAMAAALALDHAPVPPWRFAQDRLSLDGVDPRTWTPTPAFHSDGGSP